MNMLKSKGRKTDLCRAPIFYSILRYFFVNQSLPFDDGNQDSYTLSKGYLNKIHAPQGEYEADIH